MILKIGNNKNAVGKTGVKQYTEFSRPYLYKSSTQNNALPYLTFMVSLNKLS